MTGQPEFCRWTLSEIGANCQKAARGAGCLWGLAEEAGTAARLLESVGLPGAECVAAVLTSDRHCPCPCSGSGPQCGISAIARLSDQVHRIPSDDEFELGEIVGPMLLAAPLSLAARRLATSYTLVIDGDRLKIGREGVENCDSFFDPHAIASSVSVSRSAPPDQPTPPAFGSREIPISACRTLEELAAKTLVPESEHSRSSGAGPDS